MRLALLATDTASGRFSGSKHGSRCSPRAAFRRRTHAQSERTRVSTCRFPEADPEADTLHAHRSTSRAIEVAKGSPVRTVRPWRNRSLHIRVRRGASPGGVARNGAHG